MEIYSEGFTSAVVTLGPCVRELIMYKIALVEIQ